MHIINTISHTSYDDMYKTIHNTTCTSVHKHRPLPNTISVLYTRLYGILNRLYTSSILIKTDNNVYSTNTQWTWKQCLVQNTVFNITKRVKINLNKRSFHKYVHTDCMYWLYERFWRCVIVVVYCTPLLSVFDVTRTVRAVILAAIILLFLFQVFNCSINAYRIIFSYTWQNKRQKRSRCDTIRAEVLIHAWTSYRSFHRLCSRVYTYQNVDSIV